MSKVKELTVIECPYNYNAWRVDCINGSPIFSSELKNYQWPRAVDLYHEADTYSAMGVPYEIHEINYENYKKQYGAPYAGVTREFSDAVYEGVSKGNGVLIAGGFCNYAPAIVGGIQRAIGEEKRIGVVWLDAHSDCRIAEESPEGVRLVGVPMSMMLGITLDEFRTEICGLKIPCKGEDIIGGDMRIMDEKTAEILSREHVQWLDATAINSEEIWNRAIERLAERVDAIYLSVDADILKPKYVPAYFKTVPYGNEPEVIKRNVRKVMETGKVCAFSTFCFDFDRYEHGGDITYASGREIVEAGLKSWQELPF